LSTDHENRAAEADCENQGQQRISHLKRCGQPDAGAEQKQSAYDHEPERSGHDSGVRGRRGQEGCRARPRDQSQQGEVPDLEIRRPEPAESVHDPPLIF
jgi:hypothetical protein